MTRITTDFRADPEAHADIGDRTRRPALLSGALYVASSLMAACRSGAALAMMSERELDDLGLLPWEVRSEDWQKDSAAAPRLCAA
jgi:uncharacterized protein YjiS (DUF1127 family)